MRFCGFAVDTPPPPRTAHHAPPTHHATPTTIVEMHLAAVHECGHACALYISGCGACGAAWRGVALRVMMRRAVVHVLCASARTVDGYGICGELAEQLILSGVLDDECACDPVHFAWTCENNSVATTDRQAGDRNSARTDRCLRSSDKANLRNARWMQRASHLQPTRREHRATPDRR